MGDHPDKLNAVELPVMDNDECRPKFVSKIEKSMICAGGEEGKDACIVSNYKQMWKVNFLLIFLLN